MLGVEGIIFHLELRIAQLLEPCKAFGVKTVS